MNEPNTIDRAMHWVGSISSLFAIVSLALLVILVAAVIVLRQFGIIVPSADEFASIALAGTFTLGLAYAVARNEHIEIRLAVDVMPRRVQFVLGLLAILLSIVMVPVLSWGIGRLWLDAFRRGAMMLGTLPIPRAIPLSVVLTGLILFEAALLLKLLRFVTGRQADEPEAGAANING